MLLCVVLVIATTGLVYELAIAAVASYVLGDSVRQFSLIIGVYLSGLGLGAYLSRFIVRRLGTAFVDVELGAALVGGSSAPLLFAAFGYTDSFRLVLFAVVALTGTLVGLELPLLVRILERRLEFRELISRALTFDYIGALAGSVGFTFVLLPHLGLSRGSLSCGLMNATVGLASTWLLAPEDAEEASALRGARARAVAVIAVLIVGLVVGGRVTEHAEARSYPGRIVHSEQTAYQRIVVTDVHAGYELYLDGHLQFASRDEYRYHEALVHPALAATPDPGRVLVGGGGDGLAVRELLRDARVRDITLVDIDPAMTRLARELGRLRSSNRDSLRDPRVRIVNDDAMRFLRESDATFDLVVLDFPDPTNYSVGKLYSVELYALARKRLAPGGSVVVQASSPFLGRRSFWCVATTLEAAGFVVRPLHAFVPSFGDWGFVLARLQPFDVPERLTVSGLRYLTDAMLPLLFEFSNDTVRVAVTASRLDAPSLVAYYLDEWP